MARMWGVCWRKRNKSWAVEVVLERRTKRHWTIWQGVGGAGGVAATVVLRVVGQKRG